MTLTAILIASVGLGLFGFGLLCYVLGFYAGTLAEYKRHFYGDEKL